MKQVSGSPFDSIEDAHELLTLFAQPVFETKLEIETDVQRESSSNFPRRAEALKLALYANQARVPHEQKPAGPQ
jgi:hypothetical protein